MVRSTISQILHTRCLNLPKAPLLFSHPIATGFFHASTTQPSLLQQISRDPPIKPAMSRKRKHEANVVKIGGKSISLEGYLTKKPRQESTKDASTNTAKASQPPENVSPNASNTSENTAK